MPRTNQIQLNHEYRGFVCHPCDRSFFSAEGLIQHCRHASSHAGEWCERCQWLFVSAEARQAHLDDSERHWRCETCGIDCQSHDELWCHHRSDHMTCPDCGDGFESWEWHREDSHFQCRYCTGEFANANERLLHEQTHLPQTNQCYGCTRMFATHSGIMIHLESGVCDCGVSRHHLDDVAFMLDTGGVFTDCRYDYYPYHCPWCGENFRWISGLFQHIESPRCTASYGIPSSITTLRSCLEHEVDVLARPRPPLLCY